MKTELSDAAYRYGLAVRQAQGADMSAVPYEMTRSLWANAAEELEVLKEVAIEYFDSVYEPKEQ